MCECAYYFDRSRAIRYDFEIFFKCELLMPNINLIFRAHTFLNVLKYQICVAQLPTKILRRASLTDAINTYEEFTLLHCEHVLVLLVHNFS